MIEDETKEEAKVDTEAKEPLIEDEDKQEPANEAEEKEAELEDKAEEKLVTDQPKDEEIEVAEPKEVSAASEVEEQKLEKDAAEPEIQDGEALKGDDNIEKQIKENPIELVDQPSQFKYEPVELPNKETLDKLQDKPVLLKHYQELNAIGVGSIANRIEDPNKVIELGSGLRMTQQQLLDIAAKRVAPVITNINDEVSKTRQEDEIKRQQGLDNKVKKHESKLQSDFEKYLGKIGKKRTNSIKKLKKSWLISKL